MSKAYSTKALPPGTILREWRLEEVLGVGGFGIVYRGRGIYFDELVAIKEYFPSSISERDEDDTVVPVDSGAEEVHALGLKKFVEEAKLLWNLSTPSRHPNIVSVRSLFEIHGTAYMVMDFEDGTALSRLLKQGKKFNQASLSKIILPIAQGLERAHRVGVLHRDIKPPNIMVGEDDRSVLIDFGSARFESGDATNTKVTFHTPPYAAIEQYVRTYDQGPWTDIYALGVVMYECIAGEKPPEVLERLHGGLGKPLAEGHWPGFSHTFLRAVDAAMTIRPDERPQSIAAWLDLFEHGDVAAAAPAPAEDDEDDDKTQIGSFDTSGARITPVAPVDADFSADGPIDTGVPETPSKAIFHKEEDEPAPPPAKPVKAKDAAPPAATVPPAAKEPEPVAPPAPPAPPAKDEKAAVEPDAKAAKGKDDKTEEPAKPVAAAAKVGDKKATDPKKSGDDAKSRWGMPMLVGIGILALVAVGLFFMMSGSGDRKSGGDVATALGAGPEATTDYAALFTALAEEAGEAGIGEEPLALLSVEDGAPDGDEAAIAKLGEFAAATLESGEARMTKVARDLPWADPSRSNAARSETPVRQKLATDLRAAIENLREKAAAVEEPDALADKVLAVQDEVSAFRTFTTLADAAYRTKGKTATDTPTQRPSEAATQAAETPTAAAPSESASSAATSDAPVTAGTRRDFASVVSDARDIARQVERLANRNRPGSNASEEEQEGYRIRQASAEAAKRYLSYLDTLESSMRGTNTEAEARNSVVKASQTRAYLQALLNRSRAAK